MLKYPVAVLAETPTSYILMVFFLKNAVLRFGLGLALGFIPTPSPKKIDPDPGPAFYSQPP